MNADGIKALLRRLGWQAPLMVLGGFLASAAAFYFLQTLPTAQINAQRQQEESLQRVAEKTNVLVEQVERILLSTRDWAENGQLHLDDAEAFNRVMVPILAQHAVVSSVHLAQSSGREILLLKGEGGKWKNRLTDVAAQGKQQHWLEWSASREKLKDEIKEQDYDPRQRPWFKGAMETPPGQIHWTAPYIFQSTQEPGISLAIRWLDAISGESHVVAFDVLLADLSGFTQGLAHAVNGYAVLLTADGRVLGLPRLPAFSGNEAIKRSVLQEPAKLGLDVLAAALQQWQASSTKTAASLTIASEAQAWQVALRPLPVRNSGFVIAVLAPESDFSPWTPRLVLVLSGLLGVGLLLAFMLTRRLSREVREPVSRLFDELALSHARLNVEFAATSALSELAPRLQGANAYGELAQVLLSELGVRLGLGQGSLYRVDKEPQALVLCGGYARSGTGSPPERINFGEGLAGQCALEQQPIVIEQPPANYLQISSVLGVAPPASIVLQPVISNKVLLGVLELAALRPFSEEDRRLIEEVMPMLAMCMEILERNERTQSLLAATQEQAQALETQQGEIKKLLDEQQAIFDNAPHGIIYTADGIMVRANKRVADFMGRRVDELVGQPSVLIYSSPESMRELGALVGPSLAAGKDVHIEWEFARKDGTQFFAMLSGQAIKMAGHERAAVWMFEDISERKRMEQEMRESQERLRRILENSPAGVSINSEDGHSVFSNRRLAEMLLTTPEELATRSTTEFWRNPADRQIFLEHIHRDGSVSDFQADFVRTDGALLTVLLTSALTDFADGRFLVTWIYDITERQKAEDAVRFANAEQNAIFEAATVGIAYLKNRIIVRGNPQLDRLFGYAPGELIGQSTRIWFADDASFHDVGDAYTALSRGEVHQREQQYVRKDGSSFWCRISGSAVDPADLSRGAVWMLEDITERKQNEDAIRIANEEQEAILESATLGIAFIRDRVIVRGNRKLGELFGRSVEAMLNQTTRIWYPDDAGFVAGGGAVYEQLRSGGTHQREQQLIRADGTMFWCRLSGKAVDARDLSRGTVWMLEDITERKRIEAEIKHANMMNESALDLTKAGYWLIDYSDPDYYTSSERAAAIFGEYPKEGWRYHLTEEWYNRIVEADPKVAEATSEHYAAAVAGSVPRYDCTYCYKRPVDGQVAWIRAIGTVTRDANGHPLIMYGVSQDVTELRLAEFRLEERMSELERFNRLTIDREEKMIELKGEINELRAQAGLTPKYKIVE